MCIYPKGLFPRQQIICISRLPLVVTKNKGEHNLVSASSESSLTHRVLVVSHTISWFPVGSLVDLIRESWGGGKGCNGQVQNEVLSDYSLISHGFHWVGIHTEPITTLEACMREPGISERI